MTTKNAYHTCGQSFHLTLDHASVPTSALAAAIEAHLGVSVEFTNQETFPDGDVYQLDVWSHDGLITADQIRDSLSTLLRGVEDYGVRLEEEL